MNARIRRQGRFLGLLHGEDGPRWGLDPGEYEGEAVQEVLRGPLGWTYGHWFRMDVQGWEHVPVSPTMIVSNHSGGTSIPDAWGFLLSWYRHFGTDRPLHPMAHELVLSNRVTGEFFARRGVLRASRALARDVLREWRRDLMVMPGGDLDTWRPYSERYEVHFGGRTGYARMALEEDVPVVPVAHAGAHETLVVLSSGTKLARALGLPKLVRAEIWPVHLSLPWGLGIGPLPHLPTPARLRYRIGAPIHPRDFHAPGAPVTEEMVTRLDAAVRRAVQDGLDELARERVVLAERVVDGIRALRRELGRQP